MARPVDIDNWFTFHPVRSSDQRRDYEAIRDAGKEFARVVNEIVPDGVELPESLKAIRDAVMWANAGIACNPPVIEDTPPI
jgi:hypothetical protein